MGHERRRAQTDERDTDLRAPDGGARGRGDREKNKPVIGRWKWRGAFAETFYFARLKLFFIASLGAEANVGATAIAR